MRCQLLIRARPASKAHRERPAVTAQVPPGVDWKAVIDYAMDTYNLEIWGGLGQTIGKIWRVGIMGYNATPGNVELVLAAFREALKAQGKLGNKDRPFLT